MTAPTVEHRIRVYSAVSPEYLTLVDVPQAWVPVLDAIEATGTTVYGPAYQRRVVDTLHGLRHQLRAGYSALAWDDLVTAARFAGVDPLEHVQPSPGQLGVLTARAGGWKNPGCAGRPSGDTLAGGTVVELVGPAEWMATPSGNDHVIVTGLTEDGTRMWVPIHTSQWEPTWDGQS